MDQATILLAAASQMGSVAGARFELATFGVRTTVNEPHELIDRFLRKSRP